MPPVLKMIITDELAFAVTFGSYHCVRSVFEHLGIRGFRVWDSNTTAWKDGTIDDPMQVSAEHHHTVLLRLPTVTKLECWAEILTAAYGPCPTYRRRLHASTSAWKGKQRAFI